MCMDLAACTMPGFALCSPWPSPLAMTQTGGATARLRLFTSTQALDICPSWLWQDNRQLVVSVTNRLNGEQTWFNEARTKKPQSFVHDGEIADPTDGGKNCDFCKWDTLTAEDSFGRIELEHAVTGRAAGLLLV